MKPVTKNNIRVIAQLSGVSVATVSRVLNGSANVRPETRERVQKVIDEQHFVPNAIARDLSLRRSEFVAVVVPDLQNPFFYGVIQGITRVAEKNGYQVLIFNTEEDAKKEYEILSAIRERYVAGILISAAGVRSRRTASLLRAYRDSGIPVILIDRFIKGGEDLDSIMADNEPGAFSAVSELIRQGHERVAIIAGKKEYSPVYERELGYRRALSEKGIPIRDEYISYGNQMSDKSFVCMKKLMSLKQPPTAVFCGNNMMTLGALRYLIGKGIQVGKDIALIGFDDIKLLNDIGFPLSVVDRSEREMGRQAMKTFLQHMENSEVQSTHIRVPARLILRGSEKTASVTEGAGYR